MSEKPTTDATAEALERLFEQASWRGERERNHPSLLLDRIATHLHALIAELKKKHKFGSRELGGWVDNHAALYLVAAQKALAKGDATAATVEMFYLGQELVKLGAPIDDSAAFSARQGKNRAGARARWKKPVQQIVRDIGSRDFDRVLAEITNQIGLGFFTDIDDVNEFIEYKRGAEFPHLNFAALRDHLSRKKNFPTV